MNRNLFILLNTIFVLWLSISISFGQQTAIYELPEARYRTGLELYEIEKYGAAQDAFVEVIEKVQDPNSLMQINARFYAAVCALELENADAEYKLQAFIDDYPESANAQLAYFQLGRYQFKKANYANALKSFKKVDLSSLTQTEKSEYYFKRGFCFYKKKEYNKAKTEFRKLLGKESRYANDAIFYYAHIAYTEGDYKTALEYFDKIKHIRAYSKLIPYYLAHIYHQQGEYERVISDAMPLYKSASSKDKNELALIIGDSYYQLAQYDEALPYLETYGRSSRRSMDREGNYELGFTYFKNGLYAEAISFFQQVTGEDDALAQNAYYHLGYAYLETGQKKFASNAFAAASKYDFDEQVAEDALFNYAKLSMEISQDPYNSAIKNLEDYIRQYPDSPRINEAYQYLANLYLSTKNYKEALESIRKIKSRNKALNTAYQKILFFRGVEFFNQKQYEEAIELFKESQNYTYDAQINLESNFWIGESFYRTKNYWGAIKYYKNFIGKANAREATLYPVALYNLGYTYFKRKHYENAIFYWEKLLNNKRNTDPKVINDALIRLGDAYLINKNYPQAIRFYNEAIRMNKVDVDYALSQKARAESAQGKFNDKIRTLNQLISSFPSSPLADDAKYEIATTYLILNKNQQALTYFSKVVKEHPKSIYAVKSMLKSGLVYYGMDQFDQGIKVFKQVIKQYPGTQESKEALASLRNIYVDINKVDEYYAYANSLSFADVSTNEQDSITYIAAENIYMENRCGDAIVAFDNYIRKYPQGYFAPNANFYMAECLSREDDTNRTLSALRKVIALPNSRFTENALLKASALDYSMGNYEEAVGYYAQLEEIAGNKNNRLTALIGQMQCNYLLGNYRQAGESARKVLQTETVSSESIIDAHFILAHSFFAMDDLNGAQREFSITEKLTNTAIGAESKYYLAYLAFLMDKNTETENLIFELVDQYAGYDYWVAKSFILLSDLYYKQGNNFQAKQTLQSVIENYKGRELGTIAREKLNTISNEEEPQDEQEQPE